MSDSTTAQRHRGTFLSFFTVLIGLLIGGGAEAGSKEPGTARNPITATQALDWIGSNQGQCPLFPEKWRRGSTLNYSIPEIKVRSGRGGAVLEIGGRHFKNYTQTELFASFGKDHPPYLKQVVQYCQRLYGIKKNKAWSEAEGEATGTRIRFLSINALVVLMPIGVAFGQTDDSYVEDVINITIYAALGLNWVGKRRATKQLQNSKIPNLIRELFLKAQSQEQQAKYLAIKCAKGLGSLTPQSATLRKREKACKKAIDAYAPQTHAWQTNLILNQLKKNQEGVENLRRDARVLFQSTACDKLGKKSQTELKSYNAGSQEPFTFADGYGNVKGGPFTFISDLSECVSLAEKLEKVKGSELETHYEALGVLSASRVQDIIKRAKKALGARKDRAIKAENEK